MESSRRVEKTMMKMRMNERKSHLTIDLTLIVFFRLREGHYLRVYAIMKKHFRPLHQLINEAKTLSEERMAEGNNDPDNNDIASRILDYVMEWVRASMLSYMLIIHQVSASASSKQATDTYGVVHNILDWLLEDPTNEFINQPYPHKRSQCDFHHVDTRRLLCPVRWYPELKEDLDKFRLF